MTKILGYSNGEVGKLYIVSTAIVTLISIILSLPICYYGVWAIWKPMLQSFAGWLPYYISPYISGNDNNRSCMLCFDKYTEFQKNKENTNG